jgi:hypothetical protein
MANNITTFLAHELLDHVFGAATYTPPATLYFALFTVAPAIDGTGGTEVSGTAYARVAVTNNATNFPAAASRLKSNGTAVTFPESGGSWGTAVSVCVMDASSGGNMLAKSNTVSYAVGAAGITVNFAVGALDFTFAGS